MVWIPGWFDGNEWIDGYWEDQQTYQNTDLESWQPEEGVDDGWDEPLVEQGPDDGRPPSARVVERRTVLEGSEPLAVPVVIPDEE
jgi:hypothetical protein